MGMQYEYVANYRTNASEEVIEEKMWMGKRANRTS